MGDFDVCMDMSDARGMGDSEGSTGPGYRGSSSGSITKR